MSVLTKTKWYTIRVYSTGPAGGYIRKQTINYSTRSRLKALIKYLYYSIKYENVDLVEETI